MSFTMEGETGRSLTTASTLPACKAASASVAVLKGTIVASVRFSLAHASPVVPDWTPTFLPDRSVSS